MLKAYKFRIYPNKTQGELIAKTMGSVRYFWNKQVEIFNSYNKDTNPLLSFPTSTAIRNELLWMKEVSAAAIQQKEIDFIFYFPIWEKILHLHYESHYKEAIK